MEEQMQLTRTRWMTHVALTTAVLCVLGPLSLPIPISPVPISLTQFAIYLAIYALDQKGAVVAVLLYLALGAVGLPVFSGFAGGFAKLAGPTGGYLIGFVFLALIGGFVVNKYPKNRVLQGIAFVLGNLAIYVFGTAWLTISAHMTFMAALMVGVVPYLVFDVIKLALALIFGPKIRQAILRMNHRS